MQCNERIGYRLIRWFAVQHLGWLCLAREVRHAHRAASKYVDYLRICVYEEPTKLGELHNYK